MKADTCVYLHTRFCDGVVFYVGIGDARRPYSERKRNKHWHSTTEKYAYTITVLHENLSWEDACAIEIQLIAKYRELSGKKLCNITDGGDGLKNPSPETRAKMSTAATGRTHTAAARAKISAANKNRSPETLAKLAVAATGNINNLGKKRSEEMKAKMRVPKSEAHKAKLSAVQKGKTHSAETRAKMSLAQKRKIVSEETKAKISMTKKLAKMGHTTNVVDLTPTQAAEKLSKLGSV